MSEVIDIKAFNFLVHYGPQNQFNLSELVEEALLEVLRNPPRIGGRVQYLRDIEVIEIGHGLGITGLMYKHGEVSWKSVPNEDLDPIDDPGSKNILPYSRFILTVPGHRLLWLTERKLSKSPSAIDFCRYLKRACLPILRLKYKMLAEIDWAAAEPEIREVGFARKSEYISEFLKANNISSPGLDIRVVPEVSLEKVEEVLSRTDLLVSEARLFPHMNNVTDDDCEELFTKADKLAKSADSKAYIDLKPIDPKQGIAKKAITDVLEINDRKKLLKFELTLKKKDQKGSKPIKLSSTENETDTNIARAEMIEGDLRDATVTEEALVQFPDIADAPDVIDDLLKTKIEEELESNE